MTRVLIDSTSISLPYELEMYLGVTFKSAKVCLLGISGLCTQALFIILLAMGKRQYHVAQQVVLQCVTM